MTRRLFVQAFLSLLVGAVCVAYAVHGMDRHAVLLAVRALWRMSVTRIDLLLAGYLALGALSALMATKLSGPRSRVASRSAPPVPSGRSSMA